jgi:hypothetical protein
MVENGPYREYLRTVTDQKEVGFSDSVSDYGLIIVADEHLQ